MSRCYPTVCFGRNFPLRPRRFLQFRRYGFRDNMLNAQEKSGRAVSVTSLTTWATLCHGSVQLCVRYRSEVFYKRRFRFRSRKEFCDVQRLVVSRGCFPCVDSGQSTQQVFCLIVRGAPIGVAENFVTLEKCPQIAMDFNNSFQICGHEKCFVVTRGCVLRVKSGQIIQVYHRV